MTKARKPKIKQFRLSIPYDDQIAMAWCNNQGRELSLAIRELIRHQYRRTGTRNIFATTLDNSNQIKQVSQNSNAKPVKKQPKKSDNQDIFDDDDDDFSDLKNMMD